MMVAYFFVKFPLTTRKPIIYAVSVAYRTRNFTGGEKVDRRRKIDVLHEGSPDV